MEFRYAVPLILDNVELDSSALFLGVASTAPSLHCLSAFAVTHGPFQQTHPQVDIIIQTRKDMTSYPTALAPQLNQVPEDAVAGQITPSHGGMIGGHEFEMPVSQSQSQQPHPSTPNHNPTTAAPAPALRGSTPNSHRPRPVSMPPQPYAATPPVGTSNQTPSSSETRERSDENRERRRHRDEHSSTTGRSSRSNRILGDYTLSKTLGAGSMGKVKLATHNITGEKVCVCHIRIYVSY